MKNSVFEWLSALDLDEVPVIPSKAMWCGFRSHPDYSNRFPWIIKSLFDDFECGTYVEIGIAQAGGLVMAYDFSPSSLIVGIDPLTKMPESKTISHPIFAHPNVHLIRKSSHTAVEDLKEILGGKTVDILVIDGDHTYDGALKDFILYLPMVSIDGLIWYDDIAHEPGVSKAWKEIKNGLSLDGLEYEYHDWGIGDIEGGKRNDQNKLGIDGVWITRTN